MRGASSVLLVFVFVVWAAACVGLATVFWRRAPAVTVALGGSLLGAVAGFLYGTLTAPLKSPRTPPSGRALAYSRSASLGCSPPLPAQRCDRSIAPRRSRFS